MYKKLWITEFRNRLKYFLDQVSDEGVYELPAKKPVLVMSEHTLGLLQKRYLSNQWLAWQYESLGTNKYGTLATGTMTKHLCMSDLLSLHALFRLVGSMTQVLQQTGAKQNASKWDVTPYIRADKNPVAGPAESIGQGVSEVVSRLFPAALFTEETYTLRQFFLLLEETALRMWCKPGEEGMDLVIETKEEAFLHVLLEGIMHLSAFALSLIDFQSLVPGERCSYQFWASLDQWFSQAVSKERKLDQKPPLDWYG